MQYGDISNKVGHGIVINADLLFDIEKKFGVMRKLTPIPKGILALEYLFMKHDLTTFIVCIGDYRKSKSKIHLYLDDLRIPYTSVIEIRQADELNTLIDKESVLGYFYRKPENNLYNFYSNLRKYFQVEKAEQVISILGG